jgi:hypothetical protein
LTFTMDAEVATVADLTTTAKMPFPDTGDEQ